MIALAVLLLLLAVLLFITGLLVLLRYLCHRVAIIGRLAGPTQAQARARRDALPEWLLRLARECTPLGQRYGIGMKPALAERLLHQAGSPLGLTPRDFFGLKGLLGLAAIGGGIPLSLLGFNSAIVALLALAGFFGPDLWLRHQAATRQARIAVDLPDFLDTTGVCLQAGMPLEPALKVVVDRMAGPLSEELGRYLQEMGLGLPREQALRNVVQRNDCTELRFLVESLLQGLELGVPIARTITAQARSLRLGRAHKAKEQAAKASPKITLITTFLITPAVFGFILALLVLNLVYNAEQFGLRGLF